MKSSLGSNRSVSISRAAVVIAVIVVIVVGVAGIFVVQTQPSSTPITTPSTTSSTTTSRASSSSTTTGAGNSSTATLTKVTYAYGYNAPYIGLIYYGIDHGIYSKYGISMNMVLMSGGGGTVAAVAAGKADFGQADASAVAVGLMNANTSNVKIISNFFTHNEFGVIYNKANISKPSDLQGKTCSDFIGNAAGILFKAFAKANNINASAVKVRNTTPSTFDGLIALGQVDCTFSISGRIANLQPIADQKGIKLGIFAYPDYGLDIPGYQFITSTSMINSNPGLVQRFVNAILESMVTAAKDPHGAVAEFEKYSPQLKDSTNLQYLGSLIKVTNPDINSTKYSTNPLTLGWVDPQRMSSLMTVVSQAYGLKNPPAPTELYTNQFVKAPS